MQYLNLDFYRGKRVFVTGHTGFKGSWLCRILINAGAEVTGYSLVPSTNPNLFSLADLDTHMNSVIGDIRDKERLLAVFEQAQPEIVLHLAAQPIVRDSYRDPAYTYETNVMTSPASCKMSFATPISWRTRYFSCTICAYALTLEMLGTVSARPVR